MRSALTGPPTSTPGPPRAACPPVRPSDAERRAVRGRAFAGTRRCFPRMPGGDGSPRYGASSRRRLGRVGTADASPSPASPFVARLAPCAPLLSGPRRGATPPRSCGRPGFASTNTGGGGRVRGCGLPARSGPVPAPRVPSHAAPARRGPDEAQGSCSHCHPVFCGGRTDNLPPAVFPATPSPALTPVSWAAAAGPPGATGSLPGLQPALPW